MILDGVTDPRNFGACLRVADAAGVQAVIAPKDRSASFSPAAAKAAAGAWETVPVVTVTNLAASIVELKDAGVLVVGAAGETEKSIYDFDQKRAFAWVLGAEGEGLRQLTRKRCDDLAKIPMMGTVESLNVSVAAGICLFETARQIRVKTTRKLPADPIRSGGSCGIFYIRLVVHAPDIGYGDVFPQGHCIFVDALKAYAE